MKSKLILSAAALIVGAAVLVIGCTFRWMATTDGYQENVYESTSIDNSVVPGALPEHRYSYRDQYLVTYHREHWPIIATSHQFVERETMDDTSDKPVPNSKNK